MNRVWRDESPDYLNLVATAKERHIPIPTATLGEWIKEASLCDSSYNNDLKYLIKMAKLCNERGSEFIVI